jgi:hypothetical protein
MLAIFKSPFAERRHKTQPPSSHRAPSQSAVDQVATLREFPPLPQIDEQRLVGLEGRPFKEQLDTIRLQTAIIHNPNPFKYENEISDALATAKNTLHNIENVTPMGRNRIDQEAAQKESVSIARAIIKQSETTNYMLKEFIVMVGSYVFEGEVQVSGEVTSIKRHKSSSRSQHSRHSHSSRHVKSSAPDRSKEPIPSVSSLLFGQLATLRPAIGIPEPSIAVHLPEHLLFSDKTVQDHICKIAEAISIGEDISRYQHRVQLLALATLNDGLGNFKLITEDLAEIKKLQQSATPYLQENSERTLQENPGNQEPNALIETLKNEFIDPAITKVIGELEIKIHQRIPQLPFYRYSDISMHHGFIEAVKERHYLLGVYNQIEDLSQCAPDDGEWLKHGLLQAISSPNSSEETNMAGPSAASQESPRSYTPTTASSTSSSSFNAGA